MATMTEPTQLRPVITFPRDAVLEMEHLKAAFNVSEAKIVEAGFPMIRFGRDRRWLWGMVLDEIAERAKKGDS